MEEAKKILQKTHGGLDVFKHYLGESYIGVADFHRIVLYDYYISFGNLELSGNKRIK